MHAVSDFERCQPAQPETGVSLQDWEQLAQRARGHADAGQLESALAVQVKALYVAQQLVDSPALDARPDDCLAAWVVSYLNLADMLALREQPALAAEYLCDAHRGVLALGSAAQHAPSVHQAAWRHVRETQTALLDWQRLYGPSEAVASALQATAQVLGGAPQAALSPAARRRLH